jgi:hypothetical protein
VKRAALVFAVLALLPASRARAVPCNTPELLATIPPEGATGVTTDATLFAAYAASADYLGEEVLLLREGAEPQPMPAQFDRAQGLLSIKPPAGLMAGTSYRVRWPGLRGVDTATPGLGREIRFTTGSASDGEAPRFEGVTAIAWDLERKRNDCSDTVEDRLIFDLSLGAADDDGGRASLTLVVFQSAGPLIDAPAPVLTRPMPPAGTPVRIALPPSRAVGHICFAALARDLTGKVSASAQREACLDTTAPPFFNGCTIGGRTAGGGPWSAALVLFAWACARRRRCTRAGRSGLRGLLLVLLALACARRVTPPVASPFRCGPAGCTQAHPRLPDDGEWECLDMAGAAICRGGDPAAGVVPGPPDPGWACGARARGSERVCVHLSPEFPEGGAAGWRCRYDHAPAPVRACVRDGAAHNLGDRCAPDRPCVDGALCAEGRCAAPALVPGCWLDGDCASGRCRFGTCLGAS